MLAPDAIRVRTTTSEIQMHQEDNADPAAAITTLTSLDLATVI
jgi:hypothetical protein